MKTLRQVRDNQALGLVVLGGVLAGLLTTDTLVGALGTVVTASVLFAVVGCARVSFAAWVGLVAAWGMVEAAASIWWDFDGLGLATEPMSAASPLGLAVCLLAVVGLRVAIVRDHRILLALATAAFYWIAMQQKFKTSDMPILWASDVPPSLKDATALLLNSQLWVVGILTIASLKSASSGPDVPFEVASRGVKGWIWLLGLALVPIAYPWIINSFVSGDAIDSLPWMWWCRKLVGVCFWSAGFEELLFRASLYRMLFGVFRSAEPAAFVSLLLFVAAHLSSGFLGIVVAVVLGAAWTVARLYGTRIDALVLSHGFSTGLFTRWN